MVAVTGITVISVTIKYIGCLMSLSNYPCNVFHGNSMTGWVMEYKVGVSKSAFLMAGE